MLRAAEGAAAYSGARNGVALGGMFLRGSRLDAVENRWRRLVDLHRERRCSFRCATDSMSMSTAGSVRVATAHITSCRFDGSMSSATTTE